MITQAGLFVALVPAAAPFLPLPTLPAQGPDATSDPARSGSVTFVDVAPIVHAKCTECHRPGAAGPFSLRTYREVAKRGPMIAWVVEEGVMPPWHPVEGHGRFKDSLALTGEERTLLLDWIEAGMPPGDPALVPEAPTFDDGWRLGTPDLVVRMEEPFEVPPTGADLYRNFSVAVPIDGDRWLTAIEVRPSSPRVLHHIVFDVDTRGRARKLNGRDGRPGWDAMTGAGGGAVGWNDGGPLLGTLLGGWAVGQRPRHLPDGLARRFPKGADLILRSHFHPSGKRESEQTEIGLYFTDVEPTRQLMGLQMPPMFGSAVGIDVPAGEADFRVEDSFTLPVDATALTVGGHAHMILREMEVKVTPPGGEARSVFLIDDWDFDWQNRYEWETPVELARGTKISVALVWDNSDENPNNPFDPPRRIRWGFQSTDEMGSVTVALVARDEADAPALWKAMQDYKRDRLRRRSRAAARNEQTQAWRMSMGDLVRELDRDEDGELSRDELASAAPRLVKAADRDQDGALNRAELEAILGDTVLPRPAGEPEDRDVVRDLDGVPHDPLHPGVRGLAPKAAVRGHVLFFTTVDCPIANSYAPEIASIVKSTAAQGFRHFLIHVDPDVTPASARRHAEEYGYVMPVLLDGDQRLARALGISRTPEVAVVTADGEVVYRGRIDDQYRAVGQRRPEPTTRDLRAALEAVRAGSAIDAPRTEAVGCTLPVLLESADD